MASRSTVRCSIGATLLFLPLRCFWFFAEIIFSRLFFPLSLSLIPRLSDILPQRAAALSDGCLFRLGKGNWVRRLGDNGAFVAENCLCDCNADILQIRTFTKLCQSSNFIRINRGPISRHILFFPTPQPFLYLLGSCFSIELWVGTPRADDTLRSIDSTAALFPSSLSCFINVPLPDTAPCARIRGN